MPRLTKKRLPLKLDFGFVRLSPAAGEGSSTSHGISARERDQFEKRVQSSSSTLSSRGSPGGVRLTRATPASDDRATASEEAARRSFDTVAVSWLCGHLDVSENALLTEDVISVDAFITGLQRCAHTLAELVKLKGTYTSLLQRGAYHSSKLAGEMARLQQTSDHLRDILNKAAHITISATRPSQLLQSSVEKKNVARGRNALWNDQGAGKAT